MFRRVQIHILFIKLILKFWLLNGKIIYWQNFHQTYSGILKNKPLFTNTSM